MTTDVTTILNEGSQAVPLRFLSGAVPVLRVAQRREVMLGLCRRGWTISEMVARVAPAGEVFQLRNGVTLSPWIILSPWIRLPVGAVGEGHS